MNPRRGQGRFAHLLLGDLFVTCPKAIEAIRNGSLREVSVGYDAAYEDHGDGRGRQKNITANHLALVDHGRCGPICRIGDRATMPGGCGRDACSCGTCDDDDDGKHTKAEVDYSPAGSSPDRCGACRHYSSGACGLVRGDIDPDDWCRLFEDKPQAVRDSAALVLSRRRTRPHIHVHV
jgi:hypothetical protein